MTRHPENRLRTPPRERFAPSEERFDLRAAAARLWEEPSGQHGHRQWTLFRQGPMTLAIYCFEAGSKLPGHVVDGPVIIQVLNGRLSVQTEDHQHELTEGGVLRLAPRVAHDVLADQTSEMLLTVCLEGPASHP